jgi:DNA-binding beta-propeller fold protein YncE
VGRYDRTSHARNLIIAVSATTTERRADVVTGLATSGTLLYASDFPGNRVRVFTTDGVWQRDISVASPGALAVDDTGNIWVAQKRAGTVLEFSPSGAALNDVDSMYGIRAYLRSTGEYLVTKDNYNGTSVIIYRWTPAPPRSAASSGTASLRAAGGFH